MSTGVCVAVHQAECVNRRLCRSASGGVCQPASMSRRGPPALYGAEPTEAVGRGSPGSHGCEGDGRTDGREDGGRRQRTAAAAGTSRTGHWRGERASPT